MKHILFIFLFFFILQGSYSQKSLREVFGDSEKSGDQYFEKYAFASAVDSYLLALKDNLEDDTLKLKIAESYRLLNDPKNASKWYGEVLPTNSNVEEKYLIHYADALASMNKYHEAKDWYLKYKMRNPDDSRIDGKIRGIENREAFYRNKSEIKVEEAPFNSVYADFSPAYFGSSLLFLSSRPNTKIFNPNFEWDDSNFLDIFQVGENNSVEPFSSSINGIYHEGPLVVFDEGRKLIFTRDNYEKGKLNKSKKGVTKLKLYYAERKSDSSDWGQIQSLPFNSDEYSVGHPTITSGGKTLFFVSDMPGGIGGTDIYKSSFENGTWSEPLNLGRPINTEGNEMFPFLRRDNELYFASNGHEGLGGLDIYVYDLNKSGRVVNPGAPINSNLDDFGLIISNDGKTGYFSSNRNGGKNNDDIFSFQTNKSLLINYSIKGIVVDKLDSSIIEGAKLSLLNSKGDLIKTFNSNFRGSYNFPVDPSGEYIIEVVKEGYFPGKISFQVNEDQEVLENNFYLVNDYSFQLIGEIFQRNTETPVPGVSVNVTDNFTGKEVLTGKTNDEGEFVYDINDQEVGERISYHIRLEKKGFLNKSIVFNDSLEQAGPIYLKEFFDLSMDKLEVGVDIGKLVDVEPIYFDLGKATIRKDAARELDKIVKIMEENPGLEIELGSHTDSRGSAASNEILSDKRAKASAAYIISQGIDKSRITGKGYGENQLINECADGVQCTEEQHQQNRRTEFKVTTF